MEWVEPPRRPAEGWAPVDFRPRCVLDNSSEGSISGAVLTEDDFQETKSGVDAVLLEQLRAERKRNERNEAQYHAIVGQLHKAWEEKHDVEKQLIRSQALIEAKEDAYKLLQQELQKLKVVRVSV